MAMSQMGLFVLAALALIATGAVTLRLARETRIVLAVLGAMLWGAMGISAFDVRAEAWAGSRPMPVFAYLGIALALLTMLVALYQLALLLGEQSGATSSRGLMEVLR